MEIWKNVSSPRRRIWISIRFTVDISDDICPTVTWTFRVGSVLSDTALSSSSVLIIKSISLRMLHRCRSHAYFAIHVSCTDIIPNDINGIRWFGLFICVATFTVVTSVLLLHIHMSSLSPLLSPPPSYKPTSQNPKAVCEHNSTPNKRWVETYIDDVRIIFMYLSIFTSWCVCGVRERTPFWLEKKIGSDLQQNKWVAQFSSHFILSFIAIKV